MGEVEITEGDRSATVAPGDEVVVRLSESATTGYQWSVESIEGPLSLIGSELRPPGTLVSGAPPGAAGERVVRLRASSSGEGTIRLGLKRTWEHAAAAEFVAAVTVT